MADSDIRREAIVHMGEDRMGRVKATGLQVKVIPVTAHVLCRWLPLNSWQMNCIVLWQKRKAVVVDPGGEGAKIARFLRRKKLVVGEYWLTHGHPDHVGGLSELFDEFPAPVRYHRADSTWVKVWLPIFNLSHGQRFKPFGNIKRIACGDLVAEVFHTPGHSGGSVCYWFMDAGVLLSGDTFMMGYRGETIFPCGDADELWASLRRVFRRIPDDVKVIPGHDGATTVGAERSRYDLPTRKADGVLERLRKRICVSLHELETAFNKVRKELEEMGLLYDGSSLDEVDCYHERLTLEGVQGTVGCMGFYHFLGLDGNGITSPEGDGSIHVPAVFPECCYGKRPLLDTLRHEFGHALADRYGKCFRGGIFRAAFGASYGRKSVFEGENWEDEHVTEYASTMTQEDFAETFMLFVKHKGEMPARYRGKRAIERKWRTVAKIIGEVKKCVNKE